MGVAMSRHADLRSETIDLARRLVAIDTCNPPGNEAKAAALIAERLTRRGIAVELVELSPGRQSLIARLPGKTSGAPALCLCGHLDTVPVGPHQWTHDPFAGHDDGLRLWGRGTTDMKGAVAAMVTAFERLSAAQNNHPVVLLLLASEETGCQGAATVVGRLGRIGALVIGEPTNGQVAFGHKGIAWFALKTKGKAAHASLPHLGENAIEKMAAVIARLKALPLDVVHPVLGSASRSVGTIRGGAATNIIPDACEITIDVRLVPPMSVAWVRSRIEAELRDDADVDVVLDLPPVVSDPDNAWVKSAVATASRLGSPVRSPPGMGYFTDASILSSGLGSPPLILLGPGDPDQAHQTDEWCSIPAIEQASLLYEALAAGWEPPPTHS